MMLARIAKENEMVSLGDTDISLHIYINICICLTSVTHVKCSVCSTLCWKIANISGSI